MGALLGLLLSVLLFAPARWLASGVQAASQGRVLLQNAQGSLWAGSAQLMLTGGASSLDRSILPGRLAWQMSASGRGLGVSLNADCCMQQALALTLMPHWSGVQISLSDSQSQWPAQLLQGLGTPWNTIQAQGSLNLNTRGTSLNWSTGRWQAAGQLQLDALNLSSHLSTLHPMGSYRFSLQGGAPSTLALSTLQGSLQLSGNGQWLGGQFRFEGEASSLPEHEAALSNLLNIIGRRNGARSIIKLG
jgi:general secretion pathway protein N